MTDRTYRTYVSNDSRHASPYRGAHELDSSGSLDRTFCYAYSPSRCSEAEPRFPRQGLPHTLEPAQCTGYGAVGDTSRCRGPAPIETEIEPLPVPLLSRTCLQCGSRCDVLE